jgi:ABC-type multidrug transport system permease subunit
MFLRSVLALVRAKPIEIRRSKTAIFWMTAFPVGFPLLFGFVMARGDARVTAYMMPGLLTTTLMSGALFGVALPLVQQREEGLLRRLHVTPASPTAVVFAHGVTALMTGFLSLVTLMLLARAIFRVEMVGSWFALAGVFVCGACALIPMGLLVGSTARDIRTAPAISNLLFFPLMFLSGSALPFAMLPDGVKRFARFLPTTYLVDTYSSVIVRGEGLMSIAGSLRAPRRRRGGHRADSDALSLGRDRPDSTQITRTDRDGVHVDPCRGGVRGSVVSDQRVAGGAPHRARRGKRTTSPPTRG